MRITEKFIVGTGILGDIAINGADIKRGNGDIFTCGSLAFDGIKELILIKGAEEFNPVVDGKALGLDSLILIKDYQDPKSTNWKIAADTIAVLGDGIAVVTDFTPAGLARKIAIGTSLDLMRKAVKGFDTSSGLAADFCAAMDLLLSPKDKGGNGDDPGTPGSGTGTPDGSPGRPNGGNGTPDGNPGTPDGSPGTPGSSPGTSRGGHGWPLGSGWPGWLDWLPDSWWTIDPLVIELSKGAKSGTNSHTHFDFDGDGFAEYTEWISDTQGLLVWDRNQNGVIDDGKELFGDYSVLNSGKNSRDGFEALADFDTNGDGCVDASDAGWSKLRVWMDNGDGFSQKNELKTLDELGIKKLNVSANKIVDHQSDYIHADGTKGKMKDYFFRTSRTDTLDKNQVAVSDEVKQLFYLPGSGTMQDSWQVAMKDETGSFAALLKSYEYATTQEEKSTILDHVLYAMAGADQTVNPRASHIDEKKFTVLEKVYGIQFKRSNSWNGPVYERIYGDVKRYYEGYLSAQTDCREILSSIQFVYDEKNGNLSIDFSSVAAKLKEKLSSDHEAGVQLVADFANAMKSLEYDRLIGYQEFCQEMTTEDDALFTAFYSAGRVVVEGGKDADRLIGMGGSELLLGKDGNDTLTAHGVDDVLIGGKGDDMLYGERGDSTNCWGKMAGNGTVTYVWNVGDGNDKICNVSDFERAKSSTGTAYIRFGNHVTQENISFTRSNDDIKITYQPTGESITIQGWFKHDAYKLDGICFADGTFIGKEELYEKALDFHATAGDDSLVGSSQDDTMSGGKGNDKLYGNNGNDILDGGEGNDYLEGGYGDDTYIWKTGDGNDTIHNAIHNFWEGYIDAGNDTLKIQDARPEDISWRVQRNDLQAVNQKTGETLKLEGWYVDKKNRVDQIIFDDGTVLKDDEVDKLAQISRGTDGDDTLQGGDTMDDIQLGGKGNDKLYGNNGNDILDGGEGNDYLEGGYGDDIQLGGKGNDKLYGNNGSDILDGGEGNDYLEGGYGDDTYIWKTGDGNDTIHNAIHSFWEGYIDAGNDTLKIQGARPEDISWRVQRNDLQAVNQKTGEALKLEGWYADKKNRVDQIIFDDGTVLKDDEVDKLAQISRGTDGDDTLQGGDTMDDIQLGGKGNDKLYGNNGNDILDGGEGNDYLEGGYGDDTYIWKTGDGNDTVHNAIHSFWEGYIDAGNDTLKIQDARPEDISWRVQRNDLQAVNQKTGEILTLEGWYVDKKNRVDQIIFDDGTVLKDDEVDKLAQISRGTDGDDTLQGGDTMDDIQLGGKGNDKLYGNNGNDILDGGEGNDYLEGGYGNDIQLGGKGNDKLYGDNGNDMLDGGEGNDYLEGGFGDDTYIWKAGGGSDTIHNAVRDYWGYLEGGSDTLEIQGARAEDVSWHVQGNDLQAVNQKTGETLKLEGWYADKKNRVDQITFDDGTVLKDDEVDKLAQISRGTDGDDTLQGGDTMDDIQLGGKGNDKLYGNNGNDILDGGEGNDYLEGGYGDDTYIWKAGDGNDTIHNAIHNFWEGYIDAGNDTMIFADGIFSKDIVWSSEKENVLAKDIQTGEEITFAGWNEDKKNRVDQIVFSDGSVFQADQIDQCIQKMNQASLEFYTPVGEMDISHTLSKTENHLVIASTAAEKQKAS